MALWDGLHEGRMRVVIAVDREWDLAFGKSTGNVCLLEGGLTHGAMLVEAVFWVTRGVPMVAMNMVSLRCGKLQL